MICATFVLPAPQLSRIQRFWVHRPVGWCLALATMGWSLFSACSDVRRIENCTVRDGGAPNAVDGGFFDTAGPDAAKALDGLLAPVIDVYSLLDEMSDLELLAHAARQRFRTFLASSYDRSSVSPAISSDTPTGWYANQD